MLGRGSVPTAGPLPPVPRCPMWASVTGRWDSSKWVKLTLDKCPFPREVLHGAGKLHQPLSSSTLPQQCHSSSPSTSLCGPSCCPCHQCGTASCTAGDGKGHGGAHLNQYISMSSQVVFFLPGARPAFCSRVLPGNGMGLTASHYIAGKHPFLFCPCPAAPRGGTAGAGEGPKTSWG